jgi:hypothetical protein
LTRKVVGVLCVFRAPLHHPLVTNSFIYGLVSYVPLLQSLGIEPFLAMLIVKMPTQTYYNNKYFVIFVVHITPVIVLPMFCKVIMIQDESYWEAMKVVP